MGEQDQLKPIGFCINPICKSAHDGSSALRTSSPSLPQGHCLQTPVPNAIGETTQKYWTKCIQNIRGPLQAGPPLGEGTLWATWVIDDEGT